LDEDNIVLAKAKGIVIDEGDLKLSKTIEIKTSIERASRTEGLERLSQFHSSKENGERPTIGLQETLKALSSIKKSKVEFLESADGIKLAYRSYCRSEGIKAVFGTPFIIIIIPCC
jgi:hypothetical protein